jgi:uncharacterized protein DUF4340
MNFRTTVILLILLLGMVAYVMFTGGGPPSPQTAQQISPQRLLDIQSNDVSKVVLTPANGKAIILERATLTDTTPAIEPAKSDWKLTSPITAYADATKVSDLVDGVVSAMSTSEVDISGQNIADFGLDDPQFTIELEAGPKSAKVDIGRQVKAGNELYVRVEGKNVAEVVGADLLDKLDTTADKLRLARLITADAATANWISIARQKDPLTLEKSGGQWQMTTTQPTTLPVEQSVVGDLVTAINGAQAVAFGDDSSQADILIGRPRAAVQIGDQRPTTQPVNETIEFGEPDSILAKNYWVRVTPPGLLATVSKETMDSILKSSLDLRDRNIVQVASASVTQIRIVKNTPATTQPLPREASLHQVVLVRRPKPKVDLTAGPPLPATQPTTGPTTLATTLPTTLPAAPPPSVWQITSTRTPADADDTKVDAALASFNPLKVDKYLDAAPNGTGQTTYYVTITTDTGKTISVMLSDPGESASAQPWGVCGDAIFNVPRSVIASLDVEFAKAP